MERPRMTLVSFSLISMIGIGRSRSCAYSRATIPMRVEDLSRRSFLRRPPVCANDIGCLVRSPLYLPLRSRPFNRDLDQMSLSGTKCSLNRLANFAVGVYEGGCDAHRSGQ